MKKLLTIAIFITLAMTLFAGSPRVYMQKVTLPDGSMPGNPTDTQPIADYNLQVYNSTEPGAVYQTVGAGNPANICLKRTGTDPYGQKLRTCRKSAHVRSSFSCSGFIYIETGRKRI